MVEGMPCRRPSGVGEVTDGGIPRKAPFGAGEVTEGGMAPACAKHAGRTKNDKRKITAGFIKHLPETAAHNNKSSSTGCAGTLPNLLMNPPAQPEEVFHYFDDACGKNDPEKPAASIRLQ
jgi:hypothetical protein